MRDRAFVFYEGKYGCHFIHILPTWFLVFINTKCPMVKVQLRLISWCNSLFSFFMNLSTVVRKFGKYQPSILIVAAALRATATAELSYRLITLLPLFRK